MAGNAHLIQLIQPEDVAPPGGHYSHAVVANGFVFVSGQLPITADGQRLTQASFATQTRQTLANLAATLKAAGTDIQHLVQIRVYLDTIENWPEFNTLYAEWAAESRPARAIIPTAPLHFGLKIEIEATALLPH